jgi:hypothetical protein
MGREPMIQGRDNLTGRMLASAAVFLLLWCLTSAPASGQEAPPAAASAGEQPGDNSKEPAKRSPWLLVPVLSSSPKLGTSVGGLGAYIRVFDPASRVSLFGVTYQYTSTDSSVAGLFARTSFGADHHRIVALAMLGYIKNDYDDYLGTGQPLKTNDDLRALALRYLFRIRGNWFIGAQGNAANYQVLGASAEDDLVLETLGVTGFRSAALGVVVSRDSRDNEDMPTRGWYLNANNLAYREALGGSSSFDAYRADLRVFWRHGGEHVLAVRQYNWFTDGAPASAQASVVLRGYKMGQYLAPYMSSLEVEERLSFSTRLGATVFVGVAGLYGASNATPLDRQAYPTWGAGLHFVIKPAQHLLANVEYAQGIEDNRGIYMKLGYAW